MQQSPILKINNLSKSYQQGSGSIEILQHLNLSVLPGETVAIIGESGSGKSTLLSLIAGLDYPSSGEVLIDGHSIAALDEKTLTKFRGENLGIIFQQFHLMKHLTALQNVQLPLDILGYKNTKNMALDALKHVKLDHRAHHLPHELSGGENQRVAIARSFVVTPKLLLADEPSGSLDSVTGNTVMDILFQAVKERQMTLVLVTHNLELAKRCDHVWVLKNGSLIEKEDHAS